MKSATKKVFSAFFLLFLGVLSPSLAAVSAVTSPKQVTVFPNGARVVREGTLELTEGVHEVVFPDLPASVIESSLRLSVEGPKGTKLYGVSFKKEYTSDVVDARTRRLNDRIQVLQDQKTDLSDQIESRQTEIAMLKTYTREGGKKEGVNNGKIADFTLSASTIAKRIADLTASNRKDERIIRDIDSKITALSNQLAQGSSSAREKRAAQADIELTQAGATRFKLTYQVAGASWTPVYDLNLDTTGEKPSLELGFNAGVRQSTGEDWKGVSLTLSTSRPTESTQVPDPTNWWLNYYTTQTRLYRKSMGLANAPAAMAMDEAVASKIMSGRDKELEPAEVEMAQSVQAAFAVNYSIKVRRDIPSDGSDHRVGIVQESHPVEVTIVAVPRLALAAYLEAKIAYNGEQILLPGSAQLFRDGDFVGNASLTAKAPGESFELGFGQDDLIRVERKMVEERSGKSGFFSKGERRYRWVTTLANYHQGLRTVEVREQLPRVQQKDIKVETVEITPKALAENPEKPGLICWKMDLKPKEKTKITFAYKVNYPGNIQLSGLE